MLFRSCVEKGLAERGLGDGELRLISPREPNLRGGQVAWSHPNGYAVVQALIAEGVIGDFRAPDLIRFGFSPLYLRFADVDRAAETLVETLATRSWDQPRFTQRRPVT